MKLYFWDWNHSLTIERSDVEMPFNDSDEAESQDCYTSLAKAKQAAYADLNQRIDELERAFEDIMNMDVDTVKDVKTVRGL